MRVNAETKAATRQRILDVAQRLLAQKGYDSTTTRDIAVAAEIATGTLFNYFGNKEAIVACLASESLASAEERRAERPVAAISEGESRSLAEDLFDHIAFGLRTLKTLRKHLTPLLETALTPLANSGRNEMVDSWRVPHLERVAELASAHGIPELTPVALQLYWTLYLGVLAHWANDTSPKQEDTLALLDESMDMFVSWLNRESDESSADSRKK